MKQPSGLRISEHAAHTCTHTPHTVRPWITCTSRSPTFDFPFGRMNLKYPPPDHPGGVCSCTIGRKPIRCTEVQFSRSSSCVLFPRHTTHIPAPAFTFSPAIRLPRTHLEHFEFCVFSNTFFRENGASRTLTLRPNSSVCLPFVSSESP